MKHFYWIWIGAVCLPISGATAQQGVPLTQRPTTPIIQPAAQQNGATVQQEAPSIQQPITSSTQPEPQENDATVSARVETAKTSLMLKLRNEVSQLWDNLTSDDKSFGILLDFILLLFLFLGAYMGFRRGLFSYILFVGSSGLFLLVLEPLFDPIRAKVKTLFPTLEGLASTLTFCVILVLFFATLRFLSHLIHYLLKDTWVGYVDCLLGAITGLALASFALSCIVIFLEDYAPDMCRYTVHSRFCPEIRRIAPEIIELLKTFIPKVKSMALVWKAKLRQG